MAKILVLFEGKEALIDLARVPVAGDFIAKGNGAVEAREVVLVGPGAPMAAIVACAAVQQRLSADIQNALNEAGLTDEFA